MLLLLSAKDSDMLFMSILFYLRLSTHAPGILFTSVLSALSIIAIEVVHFNGFPM